MPSATWILERCASERFPYRLRIVRGADGGQPLLALRVQDRWPGANRNIFCLRERGSPDPAELLEEVERVPVVALQRRGKRLTVVLDRPRSKRCDFLFLEKSYRDGRDGSYEQIFWQTQQSMRQRRPSMRIAAAPAKDLTIRIAHDERYPWRFAGADVSRGRLPAGDYALMDAERPLAVVERKTFENLLADFGVMPMLHGRLVELASYEHHALVVEAPYEHFLDPKRLEYYSAAYCAQAIAALYAAIPRLRIVFCANRKAANEWTRHFFAAVQAREQDRVHEADPEPEPEPDPDPGF
jgi:hypothetical protein